MSAEQKEIPLGDESEPELTQPLFASADVPVLDDFLPEEALASAMPPLTAGQMIRQARVAQGMHTETLASALKVPTRKIEALEADDLNGISDLAFTRALTAAVCRHLKLDSAAVLALLPQSVPTQLRAPHIRDSLRNEDGQMGRSQATSSSIGAGRHFIKRPLWVAAAIFLILAIAILSFPELRNSLTLAGSDKLPEQLVPVPSAVDMEPVIHSAAQQAVLVASAPLASSSATLPASQKKVVAASLGSPQNNAAPDAASVNAPLLLRASGESWLQVTDASGRVLLSRTLAAGESVPLTGKAPFRLIVGRAELVSISYQGAKQAYPTAMQTGLARLSVPAPAL